MSTQVFDLEADNLYRDATCIHCISIKELDTGELKEYGPDEIRKGLEDLYYSDQIIGHNICGFDIPLIQRFYPKWKEPEVIDTLVFSRLLDPERQLHSLDSYGKQFKRFKPVHEDWSRYSAEMQHRCSEDVEINAILHEYLLNKAGQWDWKEALELEQAIARIHLYQTVAGVDIDLEHALEVVERIDEELVDIDASLMAQIPPHYVSPYTVEVKRPFLKDGSYSKSTKDWFEEVI